MVPLYADGLEKVQKKIKFDLEYRLRIIPTILDHSKSSSIIVHFRMNEGLTRDLHFEKLKNKLDKISYYNISSSFYLYEEYKIDQIDRVNKKNALERDRGMYYDEDDSIPNKYNAHIPPLSDYIMRMYRSKMDYFELDRELEQRKKTYKNTIEVMKNQEIFVNYKSKFIDLPQDPDDSYIQDIFNYVNEQPLYILVVGKPKTGVSTLCKSLATQLGVVLISIEKWIEDLLNKIREDNDNPQTNEEGERINIFSPFENEINNLLLEGKSLSQEQQIKIYNLMLATEAAQFKGFIFDFPIYENEEKNHLWADKLQRKEIITPGAFSHVICLEANDSEIRFIASNIMENPEDFKASSLYDREIVKKPKVKPPRHPEDSEEEEEQEEEEEKPPALNEKNLVYRSNESMGILQQSIQTYKEYFSYLHEFIFRHMEPSRIIKIDVSGLNQQMVIDAVIVKMKDVLDPLRPVPAPLEETADDNLVQLLRQGMEDEGKPSRRWSPWRNIDPVALYNGKATPGKGEFPAEYAGRFFVFMDEKNRNLFLANPKKYLIPQDNLDLVTYSKGRAVLGNPDITHQYGHKTYLFESKENREIFQKDPRKFLIAPPRLPETCNIAILGPPGSGKEQIAEMLGKKYGWKVVNVEEMVANKLMEMKSWTEHMISNPKLGTIHPSEEDFKNILKGGVLTGAEIVPMILFHLGYPLYKRPPKPIQYDEETLARMAEEEAKKKAEEEKAALKAAKKSKKDKEKEKEEEERKRLEEERKKAEGYEEERPPTPPPEDIKLKEIGVAPREDGTIPPVQGFVLVGFPQNKEHIEALKDHNILFDRILILTENGEESEEEPGTVLKKRGVDFIKEFSLENELNKAKETADLLKEEYPEIIREVPLNYPPEELENHILWAVDPFYINVDKDGEYLNPGDVENDDPIRYADCGPYCAVTLADDDWLVPGNEKNELQVRSKRYRFFTEKDQTKFKNNVKKYVDLLNRKVLKAPPPRLLMMGIKGSGLHTQMTLLNKNYKISRIDLANDMLEILKSEKEKRKRERELKRGFKPRELDEDGKELPDPEIDDDPDDFDIKLHEIDVLKKILDGQQEIIINANMHDIEEGKIQTPLIEMMTESKRLPEVAVFLKCKEESVVNRIFNQQIIVDKYNEIMKGREEVKNKKRADKIAELKAQKMADEELEDKEITAEELQEIENDLDDGEAPVLQEMIDEEKRKLIEAMEAQNAKIDDAMQAFQDANIPTFLIETDRDIESVYKNITFKLNPFLEKRDMMFEKFQIRELKEAHRQFYEKSYSYRKSKFGDLNLNQPWALPREKEFPVVYRSRIYYFRNDEERKAAMEKFPTIVNQEGMPRDIPLNMKIFLIGRMKAGKSTLAKILEDKLGLVRIKMKNLLKYAAENPFWQIESFDIEEQIRSGHPPSNAALIEIISKRIQMADCQTKGFVLDGFPMTRDQAILLSDKGIVPDLVINLDITRKEVMERCKANKESKNKFGYDIRILHERLDVNDENLEKLHIWYHETYGNTLNLSTKLSKGGLLFKAKKAINHVLMRKYQLPIGLITKKPTNITNLCVTEKEFLANAGEYLNFSPVALKTKGNFIMGHLFSDHIYLYNNKFYFLANEEEARDFIKAPTSIIVSGLSLETRMAPIRPDYLEVYRSMRLRKELKDYCAVSVSKGNIVKGLPDSLLYYNSKFWCFYSENELIEFAKNPKRFDQAKLPDKLPISEIGTKASDINPIRRKAKLGEATAYLEHHLGNITMRVMAQLGNKRLKYPTLGYKETALKFMAISLKANNPNKDEAYRKKYTDKLKDFINHCNFAEILMEEAEERDKRKAHNDWSEWDEENYLTRMEEFHIFITSLKSDDKMEYFKRFIR